MKLPSPGLVQSVAAREERVGRKRKPPPAYRRVGLRRETFHRAQSFSELGARLTVLPYSASREEILARKPNALVVSPGPGDPTDLPGTIEVLRGFIGELPMFGVCLGHPTSWRWRCRAKTFKLPYGHRGGNHPVKDTEHDAVIITAHNHGYAVDGALAACPTLVSTMVNLNDGTNEGFRHRTLPIRAVQFHPEASPGPFDARYLLKQWIDAVQV